MFIKIFDEKAALELEERGFSYTTETVDKNTTLYCFEATPEFLTVFNGNYSEKAEFLSESTLRFEGKTSWTKKQF